MLETQDLILRKPTGQMVRSIGKKQKQVPVYVLNDEKKKHKRGGEDWESSLSSDLSGQPTLWSLPIILFSGKFKCLL